MSYFRVNTHVIAIRLPRACLSCEIAADVYYSVYICLHLSSLTIIRCDSTDTISFFFAYKLE